MTVALVDNDILYKSTAYGHLTRLLTAPPLGITTTEVLQAAYFVVRKKLEKAPPNRGRQTALQDLDRNFEDLTKIEPSAAELRLAAELERLAQEQGVALDAGESLLCAVLSGKETGYLLTGDKRAIAATESLSQCALALEALWGRIVCLEQLVFWLIASDGVDDIRRAICHDKGIDTALTVCFSCASDFLTNDDCQQALMSYIGDLRNNAPAMLYPSP